MAMDAIDARKAAGQKPTGLQVFTARQALDALKAAEDRLALFNDNQLAKAGPLEWSRTFVPRIIGQFNVRFLDPIDTIMKRSNSSVAREATQKMIEIPALLQKNLRGLPTDIAVSTEADQFMGAWATWRDKMWGGGVTETVKGKIGLGETYFAQARQAGFVGSQKDFSIAVDSAVRRGFTDPNPGVQRAAQDLKKLVIDPVRDYARAAGIDLPDEPFGAAGFAPRRYNLAAVIGPDGQGTAFKKLVQQYQHDKLMAEAAAQSAATGKPITPRQLREIKIDARNFAHGAFETITKGNVTEDSGFANAFMGTAGGTPFKARTVPVPDDVLVQGGFLDQSIDDLMQVYLHSTVPTILLARRFKTKDGAPDPSLENSIIPAIQRERDQLVKVAKTTKEREAINADFNRTVQMVRDLRDSLVHRDRYAPRTRQQARMESLVDNVKRFQVIRLLGNNPLTQLPDVANVLIRQGPARMARLIGDSAVKAARMEGFNGQAAADEAKRMGAAIEWAAGSNVMSMADLDSPLQGVSGPFTRGMHNLTRTFSVLNFATHWNDITKRAVYRATTDRILANTEKGWANLDEPERAFMSMLGIGEKQLERIGTAWQSQAAKHDGYLRWAEASTWADKEAARSFSAAMNKDVASTIIRPRAGDRALAFSTPMISLLFQFQSFLMSHALRTLTLAEQRVRAFGPFSQDALRIYMGVTTAVALGWMAERLYAMAKDAILPEHERRHVRDLEQNPGQHIARAVDRSSILGLFGQTNGIWERMGAHGQTRLYSSLAGDQRHLELAARGRTASDRDVLAVLLGPSASQFADLARFGVNVSRHHFADRDYTTRDAFVLRQALPFQNLIWSRKIFDEAERLIGQDLLGVPHYRYERKF
jgi:hypothetical protein